MHLIRKTIPNLMSSKCIKKKELYYFLLNYLRSNLLLNEIWNSIRGRILQHVLLLIGTQSKFLREKNKLKRSYICI